jgi:hypothetical protein
LVDNGDDFGEYECSIIRTNRDFDVGDSLFRQGLFTLEVALEQIVYVESMERVLPLEEVTTIVESGFTRGEGGRVRFRSILVSHPEFSSVVNIDVLQQIAGPTDMMSADFPSVVPTAVNSVEISSLPPSISPSQNSTIESPSTIVSANPTVSPSTPLTFNASLEPTISASIWPTALPNKRSGDSQATVIGAIVGGAGIVMASVFFLFCIWFPFCIGRKDDDSDLELALGAYPGHVSQSSSSISNTQLLAVPGVLTLEDDARSLANTTLDGKSSEHMSSPSNAPGSPQGSTVGHMPTCESFDESSIYTSNTDPLTAITVEPLQPSNHAVAESPPRGNTNDEAKVKTDRQSIVAVEFCRSEKKGFDPFTDENEHFADDESSICFKDSAVISKFFFASPTTKQEVSLQPVMMSETNRIDSRFVAASPVLVPTGASPIDQCDVSDEHSNAGKVDVAQLIPSRSSSVHAEDKSLLRHFLKETVNTIPSTSTKSRSSLQSAPSRLVAYGLPSLSQATTLSFHGRPPPHEHRRVATDTGASINSRSLQTRRFGGSARSNFLQTATNNLNSLMAGHQTVNGVSSTVLTNNGNASDGHKNFVSSDDPLFDEYVGLQMPSTDLNPIESGEVFDVFPRKTLFNATIRDDADTPTLSSGLFGTSSGASSVYDSSSESGRSGSWHTDENTLDSLPRASDVGSASSRSSHSSLRSASIVTVGTSVRSSPASDNFTSTMIVDEQKTADHVAFPSSWHNDLSLSIAAKASTLSGSTASRATLSSIFDAHYEKKYVEVFVPPGKIDVVLFRLRHGKGTVVSEVRSSSSMNGKLSPGDELSKFFSFSWRNGQLHSSLTSHYIYVIPKKSRN